MDENHSDHDKSARSIRKNEDKEFSILASSKIETTRKDRRKQKNPQRWQEQKKVRKSTTGRKKTKKIDKKDKGRGAQKNLEAGKIVSNAKAKIQEAAVPRKVDLAGAFTDLGEAEKFEKVLNNFEKKLNFINDIETLRLVWFLIYIIVKEKRERAAEAAQRLLST